MSNDVEIVVASTLSSILDNSTNEGIAVVEEFLEQPEAWQSKSKNRFSKCLRKLPDSIFKRLM